MVDAVPGRVRRGAAANARIPCASAAGSRTGTHASSLQSPSGLSCQPVAARSSSGAMRTESPAMLAIYAMTLWTLVTVVRILWVYPGTYLPPLLSRRIRETEPRRNPRGVFLIGWAGLRGSVTMAAALSIPVTTASGAPFPGRDLVIFLAATTIVLTLVVNGLTLLSVSAFYQPLAVGAIVVLAALIMRYQK